MCGVVGLPLSSVNPLIGMMSCIFSAYLRAYMINFGLNLTCKIRVFAMFDIYPQCLSTLPFWCWCFGAAILKTIEFSRHHSLNSADLNSVPASLLMRVISFGVYVEFGILDKICSITLAHSLDVLSCIPAILKSEEYLSHKMRKYLHLVSTEIP